MVRVMMMLSKRRGKIRMKKLIILKENSSVMQQELGFR